MKGLFITFEGIEGSGKSTQAYYLYKQLSEEGIDAMITREPGGNPTCEKIRKILLESESIQPLAELFLFLADRNQHIRETILPALQAGKVVICDRFYHSTFAYQASGRKLDIDTVHKLNKIAIEGLEPNAVFIIDVPVDIGFERVSQRNASPDRIEREDKSFHDSIRTSFVEMSKTDSRLILIDGTQKIEAVRESVHSNFTSRFPEYRLLK